jgi:hypothetical protein
MEMAGASLPDSVAFSGTSACSECVVGNTSISNNTPASTRGGFTCSKRLTEKKP